MNSRHFALSDEVASSDEDASSSSALQLSTTREIAPEWDV